MRPHPDQHYGCYTYAQHGEDIVFLNIFKLLGVSEGTYLDIGAHHPSIISNTKLLYERGWRGVNVDANPYIMHEFERERPGDINLNLAVVPDDRLETEFFMYARTSGRNTADPQEVERMKDWNSPRETITVPAKTLNAIIEEHFINRRLDLLTVDIEGMDYEVLRTTSFAGAANVRRPKVICVEVRQNKDDFLRFVDMMMDKSYSLYARFGENLIFVHTAYMRILFGD